MIAGNLRERGVLFSQRPVERLLAGAKTQTRRPVLPQPLGDFVGFETPPALAVWEHGNRVESWRNPLGVPGDRLWVREAWQALVLNGGLQDFGDLMPPEADEWWEAVETSALEREHQDNKTFSLLYRAGADEQTLMEIETWGWRPSIHMRRWACRLVLEITSVRAERLQAISDADLLAEGYDAGASGLRAFAGSWDATYEKKGVGWDADPWVWVAAFKVVEKPAPLPERTPEEDEEFDRQFREKVHQHFKKERGDA